MSVNRFNYFQMEGAFYRAPSGRLMAVVTEVKQDGAWVPCPPEERRTAFQYGTSVTPEEAGETS